MAENTGHPVILSEAAIADMSELGCWIEQRADADTAQAYVARIEATCFRLATFPNRGTPRFDISAGLRTVSFERRVTISYRVVDGEVQIVRIIPAARDFGPAFGND